MDGEPKAEWAAAGSRECARLCTEGQPRASVLWAAGCQLRSGRKVGRWERRRFRRVGVRHAKFRTHSEADEGHRAVSVLSGPCIRTPN